jgi:hypothetical protein
LYRRLSAEVSASVFPHRVREHAHDPRRVITAKANELVYWSIDEVAALIETVWEDTASPRVLDDYYRRANLSG